MGSHTVTLKLLQRLSDQNRTEKLREAMEACGVKTLRAFCQDVGLRVRRKKYEAYQCKAGFIELLTNKLAIKTKAKRNKIATRSSPPPSKKQSYLLLLRLILSKAMPSTLLEEVLSRGGDAAGAVRAQSIQKMKHRRTIQTASVEKASTLLKEIFPSGSRAAAMVDTELTRSLQWLAAAQSEEDEGSEGSFMKASN